MLTLINTNRMTPPIAPIGLEYIAHAARQAGIEVEILDLCLVNDPERVLIDYFTTHQPELVGVSFRNIDDCFWPSAQWFVPALADYVKEIRLHTAAPIVLGGIGYSIFPSGVLEAVDADYGIHGDGENALVALYHALDQEKVPDSVPGLLWKAKGQHIFNPPAWPRNIAIRPRRDLVDNGRYFSLGGQIGLETKRGCPRQCLYCADPVAKGNFARLRDVRHIADEAQALLVQGIDMLHLCDSEFNLPRDHALAVCREFIRRGLGKRMNWYAYLSVVPFDKELAAAMQRAGCVGIDFTTDSAHIEMLKAYGQPYGLEEIRQAVRLCRNHGMAVMMDLLLGGPGETRETLSDTIRFMKQVGPDGIGAGLGMRIYPNTGMAQYVQSCEGWDGNPNIKRKYTGPVNLCRPTFYIPHTLGDHPARLVNEFIDDDPRFFGPNESSNPDNGDSRDHNYNDNTALSECIKNGARGAYWHVMLKQRGLG